MFGTRLKVGLDVDDVLLYCIEYLCKRATREKGFYPPITPEEFTKWGIVTERTKAVYEYFNDASFYREQPPIEGAQELVRYLTKFADVFIVSAVAPEFMSDRAKRIMELFPEIPKENIILGARKDVVDLDIIFDDGGHNILTSRAKFAVLKRMPWNRDISGRLTANNFDDFRKIVDTIRESYTEVSKKHDCVCLVGPSGSGKWELSQELETKGCSIIRSYTTGDNNRHIKISETEFKEMMEGGLFFEETYFAGDRYGLSIESMRQAFLSGKTPVIVTDICGAMTIKRTFNPLIVYCQSSEQEMITSILRKGESEESTVSRILSLRSEMENEKLCDISVAGMSVGEAADLISYQMAS